MSSPDDDRLRLDPKKLLETAARLERRIEERFEGSGLAGVCAELVKCSSNAAWVCVWIRRPNALWRVASGVSIATIVIVALGAAFLALEEASRASGPADWRDIPTVGEAVVNEILLLGAAIWFFVTLERSRKRARVLDALAELRTLAHLIDIHQLSKNPDTIGHRASDTPSSPERLLDRFEMGRYLDYCSEMLSLTGKVAALYGQAFADTDAVEAVNDLEELCIGLQRKIWQKIILLESRFGAHNPVVDRPTVALAEGRGRVEAEEE